MVGTRRVTAVDESMIYVNLANAHRRPIPEIILAAADDERDPDTRIMKVLGARGALVATSVSVLSATSICKVTAT